MKHQKLRDTDLTHSQLPIWVAQTLSPDSPLYNMAFAFVFEAELDSDVFAQAWQRVVDQSDALRTSIEDRGVAGHRHIRPAGACRLEVLANTSSPKVPERFFEWCEERARQPLALDGELVDSVLVPLKNGQTGWYLNQHHLVCDAHSTVRLYQLVASEYQALLSGADLGSGGPELSSYYEVAGGLPKPKPAAIEEALAHWGKRRRRDRTVPLYAQAHTLTSTASTRLTLDLDEARSRALEQLAGDRAFLSLSPEISRLALFAALLSAWLYRISDREEQSFDAPVAGRATARARKSLGLFVELFPCSVTVAAEDSLRSLGGKCLAEVQALLRHSLPGSSSPEAETSSNIVLNYFPGAFGELSGARPLVRWIHPGHGDTAHALRLQIHDFSDSGRYTLHFDFNDQALPEGLRERSVRHFEALLDAALADADAPLSQLPLLLPEERSSLEVLDGTRVGDEDQPTAPSVGGDRVVPELGTS